MGCSYHHSSVVLHALLELDAKLLSSLSRKWDTFTADMNLKNFVPEL